MGSMHTGLEDRARDYAKLAAYFGERAIGRAGLIITGGIAPNRSGWVKPFAGKLAGPRELARHSLVTRAVHEHGGVICMQILHTGRYGYHPLIVSASAQRAAINRFRPRELSVRGIETQIGDFVRCAVLAREAGYDGVEIMGSEGYLINQFLAPRTNSRRDQWGGPIENRARFALEILRRTRAAVGRDFIMVFRLSGLELVEHGMTFDESAWLAGQLESAGVDVINTGIGWHEARVPTIAGVVPRAAFAWVARRIKEHTRLPVIATNRINDPAVAEQVLAAGDADLVSMARPLLADPHWVLKVSSGRESEINTCIACNQACLDKVFRNKRATCLVNPRAGYETELVLRPVQQPKRIAVVGAGPAGLGCAVALAERGHRVALFEREAQIGGQFRFAREVPGKEEFRETLRYFRVRIVALGIELLLSTIAQAELLAAGGYDEIVIATGVAPRQPRIAGIEHPSVISYPELLSGSRRAGRRVAIIGAGGIGFDVATFLTCAHANDAQEAQREFVREWGIDLSTTTPGGLAQPRPPAHGRDVWLLQRKPGRLGVTLGATTGWIHRRALAQRGVVMRGGVEYERIDDQGLHLSTPQGQELLAVDSIVVCAGQESVADLVPRLAALGRSAHLIGGAQLAAEIDAERAIREGVELASRL
jgi:2,4-dienoyl-CoA reductase (NADPH2)